jgi:fatty acid CoA ligase FadD21
LPIHNPSVVLTTSPTAEDVGDYVDQSRMDTAPKIVEIDSMNLDAGDGAQLFDS